MIKKKIRTCKGFTRSQLFLETEQLFCSQMRGGLFIWQWHQIIRVWTVLFRLSWYRCCIRERYSTVITEEWWCHHMRAKNYLTALLYSWYLGNNIHQILRGRQGSVPLHKGEVIPCKVSIHVEGFRRVDISVWSAQLSIWDNPITCHCEVFLKFFTLLLFCENQANALVYFVSRLSSSWWVVTSKLCVCSRDKGQEYIYWSSTL